MEPMDDSSDNNSGHSWMPDSMDSLPLRRSEMNELIMDYLVHEGFKEAADRFREEAGIADRSRVEVARQSRTAASTSDSASGSNNPSQIETEVATSEAEMIDVNARLLDTNTDTTNSNNRPSHLNGDTLRQDSNGYDNNSMNPMPLTANTYGTQHMKDFVMMNIDGPFNGDWLAKIESPDMMDKRVEVRQLIEAGDILRAQSLINSYYPELLDNHRTLYFRLQQQQLIELIRQQKIDEVLTYVHDHLSVEELRDLGEMERTLALLAYEDPSKSPYSALLHRSHRLELASDINDTILQETTGNIQPSKPRLVTLLKLLFWTQSELEKKKIHFAKMTDLINGTIMEPRL